MELLSARSFATFRMVITSLLVISIVGQQIAFAAGPQSPATSAANNVYNVYNVHAALPIAKTEKQAAVVIQLAESRPFTSYFEQGGTPAEMLRLDKDINALATANTLVGISDDLQAFVPWWDAHKTSIIVNRAKVQDANLESFFTQTFVIFKIEQTQAKRDPNQFIQFLSSKVTNPIVRGISLTAFAVLAGTFVYSLGLVKGAMVAGPAASVIGAWVEPFVRPIREKASIQGSRLFGNWGVKLSSILFKDQGGAEGAATTLNELSEEAAAARESSREVREMLNRMGHDMSDANVERVMSAFRSHWNKTNRVWVQTNPSLFKDGRDVFANAIALRPQAYSAQIMQSLQGAEQARQAIEQHIDRIISRTGKDAHVVEETVVSLLRAVEINENAELANQTSAKEGLQQSKAALKALGATDYQVERIIESRLAELVNVRHTAYTLAANMIHELQYPEYNRALPEEVQRIQRSLRQGTCLDYFHNEFKVQVSKILTEMDLPLTTVEKTIEAASETPAMKAARAPRRVAPSKASQIIANGRLRALNALKALNGEPANRAAIDRTGDLRGEKAKSAESRAEEAVQRAGKK